MNDAARVNKDPDLGYSAVCSPVCACLCVRVLGAELLDSGGFRHVY